MSELETMDKWDRRWLTVADNIALWSKDPKRKIGCVIVDEREKTQLSGGYNGFPRGIRDSEDRLTNTVIKLKLVVHAEANAVAAAARHGHRLIGSTAYINEHPCSQCAGLLIQAGIIRVVFSQQHHINRSKWANDWELAQSMFNEAGVLWRPVVD